MSYFWLFVGVFIGVFVPVSAHSQAYVRLCYDVSGVTFCTPVTSSNPLPVTILSPPGGAIQGNGTGTTGAVVGTLAASATKTTYICGVTVSALGGTATIGPITIAGPATSLVFYMASSAAGNFFTQSFSPCIPGSAINTAITTTTTADGTASNVSVNSWGFQQ
jgi:hypothetical protein